MTFSAVLFGSAATREPLLREFVRTPWEFHSIPDESDVSTAAAHLAEAAAFVGNSFPSALAGAARRLRLIQCVGAGADLFDLADLPPGCALCNVHEHEIPIAEYILLCVLLFATGLIEADRAFRQGLWLGSGRYDGAFHQEAFGRTIGFIGFGHIGRAAAARARALGMKTLAVRRRPEPHPDLEACYAFSELPRMLGACDYLAVACPLTPETRGLLGERELRMLRPHAVLINPARAAIVDEAALYRALRERWFAGAALDVWYEYPARPDAGMHGSRYPFHELPNVIVTPHRSAWTLAMVLRRFRRIAENLDRVARGEPPEQILYQASASPRERA